MTLESEICIIDSGDESNGNMAMETVAGSIAAHRRQQRCPMGTGHMSRMEGTIMWTRSNLKHEARHHLQGRYWSAFAVALIMALIGGGSMGSRFNYNFNTTDWNNATRSWQNWSIRGNWQGQVSDFFSRINGPMIALIVTGALLATTLGILFAIFVSSVIQAGGFRWFSRSREMANPPSIGFMFSLFRSGSYMQTVAAQFWRNLMLFLWSLLPIGFGIIGGIALFVPFAIVSSSTGNRNGAWQNTIGPILVIVYVIGILLLSLIAINRQYAYRMVPWILGDNPTIGRQRALNLSIEMTRGHKFNMFVLDLSFIGWFLLGVLACGIGTLFVLPYAEATQAELYDRLRALSVEKGIARMEDYGFVRVDQQPPA